MFINGDAVYAQTWEVLTLKNPIEPRSFNLFNLAFYLIFDVRKGKLGGI